MRTKANKHQDNSPEKQQKQSPEKKKIKKQRESEIEAQSPEKKKQQQSETSPKQSKKLDQQEKRTDERPKKKKMRNSKENEEQEEGEENENQNKKTKNDATSKQETEKVHDWTENANIQKLSEKSKKQKQREEEEEVEPEADKQEPENENEIVEEQQNEEAHKQQKHKKKHKKHKKNKKRKRSEVSKEESAKDQVEEEPEIKQVKEVQKRIKHEEQSSNKPLPYKEIPKPSIAINNHDERKKGNTLDKKQQILDQQKEEQSRIDQYNQQQKEVYYKINKAKQIKRRGYVDEDDEGNGAFSNELIDRMKHAVKEDHESNRNKKPALKRLMISNEIFQHLRKIPVQEKFLSQGGCQVLAEWIDQMPDGTFPNYNLVIGVLNCVDGLRIEEQHLEDSDIASVLQCYSEGLAEGTPPDVQRLAKSIVDKWSRMVYGIRSAYDAQGQFDTEYRNLQSKLYQMRQNDDSESDDHADKDSGSSQKSSARKRDEKNMDKIIERGRAGIILPERNAFDFIERPEKRQISVEEKRRNFDSGKARIQRTLAALKKANLQKGNYSKGFNPVKIDY